MQADIVFFENLLKDNQAQEIYKNLRIYSSLQEEFINFSMNSQISYIETGKQPCFNCLTQDDAHRLDKEKNYMDEREMGNRGVF